MQQKNEKLADLYQGMIEGKGTKPIRVSEFLAHEAELMIDFMGGKTSLNDYVNIALAKKIAEDKENLEKQ